MTRRAWLLAAAALLVAACGVNPGGAEGDNTTPQHGGSLKVGLEYEPRTLDPLYAESTDEMQVLRQMFDPLLPNLAASWTFSDPVTLRVELRHGVLFQNGETFTSKAVRFTLESELHARDSPRAAEIGAIDSVDPEGDYAVTIHLKRPDPALPSRLEGVAGMMLSPLAVTSQGAEYEFARNPVASGTGPFMFQFWRRGYHLILKRFPKYWGPAPYLDQLDFTQTDLAPGLDRLRASDLDVLEALPRHAVAAAQQDPNLHVAWHGGPAVHGMQLNTAPGEVFADPARAQALSGAIDRAALVSTVFAGIDPPAQAPAGGGGLARAAFTLKVDTDAEHLAEAEVLQSQLATAGFTMRIQPEDADTISADLQAHDFDAALVTLPAPPVPGPAAAAFVALTYPPVFDARGAWVRGVTFNSDGTFVLDRAWLA